MSICLHINMSECQVLETQTFTFLFRIALFIVIENMGMTEFANLQSPKTIIPLFWIYLHS